MWSYENVMKIWIIQYVFCEMLKATQKKRKSPGYKL